MPRNKPWTEEEITLAIKQEIIRNGPILLWIGETIPETKTRGLNLGCVPFVEWIKRAAPENLTPPGEFPK